MSLLAPVSVSPVNTLGGNTPVGLQSRMGMPNKTAGDSAATPSEIDRVMVDAWIETMRKMYASEYGVPLDQVNVARAPVPTRIEASINFAEDSKHYVNEILLMPPPLPRGVRLDHEEVESLRKAWTRQIGVLPPDQKQAQVYHSSPFAAAVVGRPRYEPLDWSEVNPIYAREFLVNGSLDGKPVMRTIDGRNTVEETVKVQIPLNARSFSIIADHSSEASLLQFTASHGSVKVRSEQIGDHTYRHEFDLSGLSHPRELSVRTIVPSADARVDLKFIAT